MGWGAAAADAGHCFSKCLIREPDMHCRRPSHRSIRAARLHSVAALPPVSLRWKLVCLLQEAAEAEPVHGIPGLLLADGELLEEQKDPSQAAAQYLQCGQEGAIAEC